MSSKRKWDQPAAPKENDGEGRKETADEGKSASEAAIRAAAIASKIAAQFASGQLSDPHDGHAFTKDIEINDVRNRYMLTRSSTQSEIHEETGASISTKGVWYPDKSKATEKDPPLYIHITAASQDALQKAIDKVNELIAIDLGSLVETKTREKRKWPEEKLPVGLESIRNFHIRAKVVGPSGSFVKYIQQETGTRVQIKGIGSGFIDQETGQEHPEPLYIHITGPEEGQVARAKVLTEDLLLVVRQEHAKMAAVVRQEQMELHQAQAQFAAYSAMASGYTAPPPPSSAPPPPPPGEQPPPPPGGEGAPVGAYDPSQPGQAMAGAPPAAGDAASQDAYAAYWAAYGYDVNSPQFKEWAASQQQQYSQYYAGQGYAAGAGAPDAGAAPAPSTAPPPPPPPA